MIEPVSRHPKAAAEESSEANPADRSFETRPRNWGGDAREGENCRPGDGDRGEDAVDETLATYQRGAGGSQSQSTKDTSTKDLERIAHLIEGAKERLRSPGKLTALVDYLGQIEKKIAVERGGTMRPQGGASRRLPSQAETRSGDDPDIELDQAMHGLDRCLARIAAELDADARDRKGIVQRLKVARGLECEHAEAPPALSEKGPAIRAIGRGSEGDRAPGAERSTAKLSSQEDILDLEPSLAAKHLDELQASVDELARRVGKLRSGEHGRSDQPFNLMRDIEALRRQVEETRYEKHPLLSGRFNDLCRSLEELTQEMDSMRDGGSHNFERDLLQRIEAQRRRGVEAAATAPAERFVSELRAPMKDPDATPAMRSLDSSLRALARRLDEVQGPGAANAIALREVTRQIGEIKELLALLAKRPPPLEKLETRLFDLAQRLENPSQGNILNGATREIGEAVKAIRAIVATETSNGLQPLNRRLERLSDKVDGTLAKLSGERFDKLGARIDEMQKSLLQRLDRGVSAKDAGGLETMVATLARKIDSALDPKIHKPVFDDLSRKIEKLEKRLDDPAAAQSIARIESLLVKPGAEGNLADIGRGVDTIGQMLNSLLQLESFRPDAGKARTEELVRRLGERIDAALKPSAGRRDVEQVGRQVEQLSSKLDRLATGVSSARIEELLAKPQQQQQKQLDDISERVDFMHTSLAARIEEDARARAEAGKTQLAQLGEQLAGNLNGAMSALEQQIKRLSTRLDSPDGGVALVSIEHKIAELLARVEEARTKTNDVARAASVSGSLDPRIRSELRDIREKYEQTGARTHEILSAVHEALERVVGRLAAFSEELSEIRAARPSHVGVSAPNPEHGEESADVEDEDQLQTQPAPQAVRWRERDARDGERPEERDPHVDLRTQADFIAAARRAAQQAEDASSGAPTQNPRSRNAPPGQRDAAGGVGATIIAYKRPILLALAAVAALGVLRSAHFASWPGLVSTLPQRLGMQRSATLGTETPAPAPQAAAQSQTAPLEPSGASPAITPPPVGANGVAPLAAPKTEDRLAVGQGVDLAPVGSINAPALSLQDASAALKLLAERGDAAAQYELGVRYADGRGLPRDPKASAQWIEKAAEQGLAPAQYRIGSYYEKGVGVDRDYARARAYYQRAASNGNVRAMHNLAVLYAEGGDSKSDYGAAAQWFRRAAELGVRDSQYNLAILYARGLGVEQNLSLSYTWFAIAAQQGDEDAGRKRDEIGGRLESKELAAAKARVETFKPRQPTPEVNEVAPPRGGWESLKIQDLKPDAKPTGSPAGRPKVSDL